MPGESEESEFAIFVRCNGLPKMRYDEFLCVFRYFAGIR
jgi:hypothetical protein